jgi:cytochrome c oxidase cbb3-type subunit 3
MRYLTTLSVLLLALPTAVTAAPADTGADLYQAYCTQCHGVEATGNGINAAHMSVQPRNHTDRGEMSARTDDELFKVIQLGGKSINKSVLMPAWGHNLSDAQIHLLVDHLRTLCCK